MNAFETMLSHDTQLEVVKLSCEHKQDLLAHAAYVHDNDDDYFVVAHDDKFYALICSSALENELVIYHEICIMRAHDSLCKAIAQVDQQFRIDVTATLEEDAQSRAAAIFMLNKVSQITIYSMLHMQELAVYQCDRDAHAFVLKLANNKFRACVFSARRDEYVQVQLASDHEYLSEAIAAMTFTTQCRLSERTQVELHDFDLNADFFDFDITHDDVLCCRARFDYMTKEVTHDKLDVSQFELARCDARVCNDAEFLSVALRLASLQACDACE